MTAFKFSKASEMRLVGVDPDLVAVVRDALKICTVDFMVIEGLRTRERQEQLYAQGRTVPGRVVTWTLNSKHIDGDAVDLAPINPLTGNLDWNYTTGFAQIAKAMLAAAKTRGIALRWGADWNQNGRPFEKGETDSPHFERVRS